MSIDLIEAAWSDPILRSELLASERADIPQHPAGDVDPGKIHEITAYCAFAGSDYVYYITIYSDHPCCE